MSLLFNRVKKNTDTQQPDHLFYNGHQEIPLLNLHITGNTWYAEDCNGVAYCYEKVHSGRSISMMWVAKNPPMPGADGVLQQTARLGRMWVEADTVQNDSHVPAIPQPMVTPVASRDLNSCTDASAFWKQHPEFKDKHYSVAIIHWAWVRQLKSYLTHEGKIHIGFIEAPGQKGSLENKTIPQLLDYLDELMGLNSQFIKTGQAAEFKRFLQQTQCLINHYVEPLN